MNALVELDTLDPGERFDYWCDVICDVFVKLDARSLVEPDRFTASLSNTAAGAVTVSRMRVSAHEVTRTAKGIASADAHHHLINMPLSGQCDLLVQDGRSTRLGPGDFALSDTARPYRLRFDAAFDMFVLNVPDELLGSLLPNLRTATATAVRATDPTGALLRPVLETIHRLAASGAGQDLAHLGAASVDLVAAGLAEVNQDPAPTSRTVHLLRVKRFISQQLRAPELDPPTIAAANAISVRYLHTLFAEEGTTVSRYILDRRLGNAARDLLDGRLAAHTIAEIAVRNGFVGPSHFTRTFTRKYGRTPREHRSRVRG